MSNKGAVRRALIAVILATLPLLLPETARADDAADRASAKEHFDRGIILVDARRYEEAAIEFENAYARRPSLSVLKNIGRAWAAARKPTEALKAYLRFLREGSQKISQATRTEVEQQIRELEALTGLVSIQSRPLGALVTIDGSQVGQTPLSDLRFDVGRHHVSTQKAGFQTVEDTITVSSDAPSSKHYELEPSAPTTGSTPEAPREAPVAGRSRPGEDASERLTEALSAMRKQDEQRRQQERVLAYGLSGGGLVLGALATALFVYSRDQHRDWRQEQQELDATWRSVTTEEQGPVARQNENDALGDKVQALDRWTVGTAVASGLFLGAGVALWAHSARTAEPRAAALVTLRGAELRFQF